MKSFFSFANNLLFSVCIPWPHFGENEKMGNPDSVTILTSDTSIVILDLR